MVKMDWYLNCFKNKYAVFTGRATRPEYWYYVLFNLIAGLAFGFLDGLFGLFSEEYGIGLFGLIYMLVALLPGTGVSVRRLHDTGRSGWWLLILLIPIAGALALLIIMAKPSQPESNKFDDPAIDLSK